MTGSLVGITGRYHFAGGASAGAYLEHADVSDFDSDGTGTSYGITGGFGSGPTQVNGFVGATSVADASGVDVTDFGASLRYTPGPTVTLGGSFVQTHMSGQGASADLDFMGIGGAVGVSPSLSLFGAVAYSSLDALDTDLTTVGFGANYFVGDSGTSVSVELAHSKISAGDADLNVNTLRVGLTIPLGGKGYAIPKNSVTDTVLNPTHSAFSSTVLSTF